MPREPQCECPKCDQDISHTWTPYDPDVGIMSAGWFCEACDLVVPYEDSPEDY